MVFPFVLSCCVESGSRRIRPEKRKRRPVGGVGARENLVRYRIMMIETSAAFIAPQSTGSPPVRQPARSACGRTVDVLWVNGEPVVDRREIRWITVWTTEIPLDQGFSGYESVPTDTFDGVVHRRVGGGPDYLTRDTTTSGSGRGTPRRWRRRLRRLDHGTHPTWEPRVERLRRLHRPGLSHVCPLASSILVSVTA